MDGNLKFSAIQLKTDFDINCDVSDFISCCISLPFSSLESTPLFLIDKYLFSWFTLHFSERRFGVFDISTLISSTWVF